jgi:hypothetical protein
LPVDFNDPLLDLDELAEGGVNSSPSLLRCSVILFFHHKLHQPLPGRKMKNDKMSILALVQTMLSRVYIHNITTP